MSDSAEDFHTGTLLRFREFLVSENVRDKRQGRNHEYPSKVFCLRLPKNFSVSPLSLSLYLSIEKIALKEGFVMIFCLFCLAIPENFIGVPFCVSQKFWCQNVCRSVLVSQYRKTSLGNASVLCFRAKNSLAEPFSESLILGIEKFCA